MTSIEGLITLLIKNALFFGANYTSHQVRKFEKKQKKQKKQKKKKGTPDKLLP